MLNKYLSIYYHNDLSTDHVFDERVVRAVHVDRSVEGVVDAQAPDVRPAHVAVEVEVDRVSTQAEGLPGVGHLDVAQANHRRIAVFRRRMRNDVSTKLVTSGFTTESSLETRLSGKLSCKQTAVTGGWGTMVTGGW